MRKTLLGIDLAICSLWTIAALGSRIAWVDTPAIWIVMLLIMSRLLLSFTLYHREKKSWGSGLLFVVCRAYFGCGYMVVDSSFACFPRQYFT